MTQTEIESKIAELEAALVQPATYPTEVYTRIVGYYRSLANWNAGKREEYNHRQTFTEDAGRIQTALAHAEAKFAGDNQVEAASPAAGKAASYLVFVQDKCPNCPAMKAKLPALNLAGQAFDVAADDGFAAADAWGIMATPTLVLLDDQGRELNRITSATDWKKVEAYL